MWLIKTGHAPSRYVASQGTALKRRGRIYVERLGDDVWVGGDTLVRVSGTVEMSGSPPDHP
jgi:predicted PhzF superfamily epimerase YddE/YHI9